MFYVYALTDPRNDNQPFYIGKGTGRRAHHHLFECNNKTRSFKQAVIKAIRAEGFEPGVEVLFNFENEEDAYAKEVELIARYGRRDKGVGSLTNQTDGGDGVRGYQRETPLVHTEETKRKMSESHRGKDKPWLREPKSQETRQRMSTALTGKRGRTAGMSPSQEHRDRISQANMGKACPTKGKRRIYRPDGTFYFGNLEE